MNLLLSLYFMISLLREELVKAQGKHYVYRSVLECLPKNVNTVLVFSERSTPTGIVFICETLDPNTGYRRENKIKCSLNDNTSKSTGDH